MLHEQNAVVGLTNKWLGRLATRVYSAMPGVFPDKVGAVAIGNPVRESIELIGMQKMQQSSNTLAASSAGLTTPDTAADNKSDLNVLVIGGSSGARALNEVVPGAIEKLLNSQSNLRLRVWHQTGPADETSVAQSYRTVESQADAITVNAYICLLYTSPSPRDGLLSRMPSSA